MQDDLALSGRGLWGQPLPRPTTGPLAEKFLVPPFTVLSARDGLWQDRKRSWLSIGIKGEVGRGDDAKAFNIGMAGEKGEDGTWGKEDDYGSGTSIFDPVLCELAYRWFSPEGGVVVDPFAGGSVRGIVAEKLGRKYWGCDLNEKQIAANFEQAAEICPGTYDITWIVGDALVELETAPQADLIFSCPPYGDLERYSDDKRDLSTMSYPVFIQTLQRIVHKAASRLRNNRFAIFVVGDFRDKKNGLYNNFVSDTIYAFKAAGMGLYNEVILVTAIGSLAMRTERAFSASRKLGKAHQNVLMFVKGDGKKAASACGDIEIGD
jgi:DNA modification methylase